MLQKRGKIERKIKKHGGWNESSNRGLMGMLEEEENIK